MKTLFEKTVLVIAILLATAIGTNANITVRLDSASCNQWEQVRLYFWGDNVSVSWPGKIISLDADGYYSYTFDVKVTKVSIIFTDGNGNQTTDIKDVQYSTTYSLNSQSGQSIGTTILSAEEPPVLPEDSSYTFKPSSYDIYYGDSLVAESPCFTFSLYKNNSTDYVSGGWNIKRGNSLNIRSKCNKAITRIIIDCSYYDSAQEPVSYSEDVLETISGQNKIIDVPNANITNITMTRANSGGVSFMKIGSITVYYRDFTPCTFGKISYNFGNELIIGFPKTLTGSLKNYSEQDIQITSLSSLHHPFSVTPDFSLPDTVAPGQTANFTLTFAASETGSYSDTLYATTNIGGEIKVPVKATCIPVPDKYSGMFPVANCFYDFDGNGYKEFIDNKNILHKDFPDVFTAGSSFVGDPASKEVVEVVFIDDIDHNGLMDVVQCYTSYNRYSGFKVQLAQPDGTYKTLPNAAFFTNIDLNSDGRKDYIRIESEIDKKYSLMFQQPDGSFWEQKIGTMTMDEYEVNPDNWTRGIIRPNRGAVFSGASLAKTRPIDPQRKTAVQKAQPISSAMQIPAHITDLNADGLTDLIDEKSGMLYYNMGDGKFITSTAGGITHVRDLNNDNFPDFIIHSNTYIVTDLYEGNGKFTENILFEGFAADDEIYCYDFDRDGDVDILSTFGQLFNSTGYGYTMFFRNDGNGNFTQMPEVAYNDTLVFSNVQDVDGDGYMDILAFKLKGVRRQDGWSGSGFAEYRFNDHRYGVEGMEIVWLKGQANFGLAAPQTILNIPITNVNHGHCKINAEDIDNDGKIEIWYSDSGTNGWGEIVTTDSTSIWKSPVAQVNTTPATPAAPVTSYDAATGKLTVNWQTGSDAETSSCDLTYALRIGSTPGGDDILAAHANADGSRRNFLDGNMGSALTYSIDISRYAPDTVYVALQTIDAQHKGSAWSNETVFIHNYLPVDFSTDRTEITYSDTLSVYYTPLSDAYTLTWKTDSATVISDENGLMKLQFTTAGDKTIALTITDTKGNSTRHEVKIQVLPNAFGGDKIMTVSTYYLWQGGRIADYTLDGIPDLATKTVVYQGNADGSLTKAPGIWNASLSLDRYLWYDYDHDGYIDLLYKTASGTYGYLKSNGMGSFKSTVVADENVVNYTTNSNSINISALVDFDHDGRPDGYDAEKNIFHRSNADGTYSDITPTGITSFSYYTKAYYRDINHDGYCDLLFLQYGQGTTEYSGIRICINNGNFNFTETMIPFATPIIANGGAYPYNKSNVRDLHFIDINNDGYIDMYALNYNNEPYICLNNANTSFSEAELLPCNTIDDYGYSAFFYDLDNNGYRDIIMPQISPVTYKQGWYAYYFNQTGIERHGFLSNAFSSSGINTHLNDYDNDGVPDLFGTDDNYYSNSEDTISSFLQSLAVNQKPLAPTSVTAVQTENSILIKWNDAADDNTSALGMRYNLSVKKKNTSGANSYIISPQNGGNAGTAMLHCNQTAETSGVYGEFDYDYSYLESTQFSIPLSALPEGELEIQVQAIDLWAQGSEFSDVLTVKVEAAASLSAPITVCAGNAATINYVGPQSTATPLWDFAGGTVVSGTGFGPYEILWNTDGTKQVQLTLGTHTTYCNIQVAAALNGTFTMPNYVLFNTETEITLPKVTQQATFEWEISLDGNNFYNLDGWVSWPMRGSDYAVVNAIPGNKKGNVSIKSAEVKALRLIVDDNDCNAICTQPLTILDETATPQITLITPDANNKNIITWDASSFPAEATGVVILKETNYYNEFYELARVDKSDGSYTDPSSNATVKSERYALQLLFGSSTGPIGTTHQTVHVMINRGITDNQWNLIWNNYQGRQVATYHILRGADADHLNRIASVSASNTSYTDAAPDATAPCYAIEYELASAQYAPARNYVRKMLAVNPTGHSNVVNSNAAKNITYITKMSIISANSSTLTDNNRTLYLYTEIFPTNATHQSVKWEITSGGNLATIDQNGILTAIEGKKGGSVTVKATAIDGSNISATKTFTVETISGGQTSDYTPTNLKANVQGSSVTLSWTVGVPVEKYLLIVKTKDGTNNLLEKYLTDTSYRLTNLQNGDYLWMVVSCNASNTQLGSAATGEFSINGTAIESVKTDPYIIYPNPVKDVLIVQGLPSETQISILSLLGKTLYQTDADTSVEISMINYPSGTYILTIKNAEGTQIKKIVKK